jgi:thiamine-monophosphate kinase
MNAVTENTLLARLVEGFSRSPLQLNGHQESDAELLRLPGREEVLVLQTDSIAEEIESGLYDDPYLIGWMTILVNASDLSAVGAIPVGIVLNQTLPHDADEIYIDRLQAGIRDACLACGFHVLGGDTNFSAQPQMGATVLGVIQDGQVITRRGCRPGDHLFTSGRLGAGSVYAFHKLMPDRGGETPEYRPQPRICEGRLVRRFGSAAMDTSDGAIAVLDQLLRINQTGFLIDTPMDELLTPEAAMLSRSAGLPGWSLLAGPHGEFELIFTVPEPRVAAFRVASSAAGWDPIRIGSVTAVPEIVIRSGGDSLTLDTGRIRNLFTEVGGDARRFLQALVELDALSREPDRSLQGGA